MVERKCWKQEDGSAAMIQVCLSHWASGQHGIQ